MALRPSHTFVPLALVCACLVTVTGLSRTPGDLIPATIQDQGAIQASQVPKVTRVQPPRPKHYHHATYAMAASFYDVRGQWRSRLMLNNKGPESKRPKVTLFSRDGRPFAVQGVEVPGNGFLDVDLNAVAAEAGPGFDHGSLRLTYYGDMLEMGAQVVIADLGRGLQFDEQFSYAAASGSARQEAVWWLPTDRASVALVVTNQGSEPIAVRGELRGNGQAKAKGAAAVRLNEVRLRPNEMRVIHLASGIRSAHASESVGGLSLEHDGPAGALLARGFVHDRRSGYSSLVLFSDPAGAKTSVLHGGGLRFDARGVLLEPVLVARNAGDVSALVSGRVVLRTADGQIATVPLPAATLDPHETARIETYAAWQQARDLGATAAGVELDYTTAPGSVVMSAAMVSADREHVFRVPLIDPDMPPSSTGGYPWRADGTTATTVYLKNTTGAPQTYLLQLSFAGGAYAPGLKTLQAGETVSIDIQALRDTQTADALGRTIPSDAMGRPGPLDRQGAATQRDHRSRGAFRPRARRQRQLRLPQLLPGQPLRVLDD